MRLLLPHPTALPFAETLSLRANAKRLADASLECLWQLRGNLADLRIPPTSNDWRCDGLWRHTCFEAFFSPEGESAYREFNFSPSGQWAAYAFAAYRQTERAQPVLAPPRIACQRTPDGLELTARLAADALPPSWHPAALRIGLTAVIENEQGELAYWALCHLGERPDFHRTDSFTLRLP